MSKITTLQIGGEAKDFQVVHTEQELLDLIKNNPEFLIIGGGSNLLVSDKGVDKLVIQNKITGIVQNVNILTVKSGTILQNLVDYSIAHGLAGLQKLTGIPGTVGGAVFGSAGAYGQSISDNIISVVVLSERSESKDLSKDECGFGYRDSIFKKNHDIILEVTFQLQPGNPKTLAQEAKEILAKRLVKYPKGIKCPGSFFKNIVADTLPKEILEKIPTGKIVYGKLPAGSLLEEVGAKGAKLDGIEIAGYHANLFINKGGGTAKAFYDLARKYALAVKQKFGITLEPEVQLINLPPIA
ncbi:UDP-N-acetylmuramate dehydrogenase [Candidatus Daviesbacteria bacterium]|nr:UDP-N-acetylmuramate dehydrogenase [Candidatus Daviesbacteria bacterium]